MLKKDRLNVIDYNIDAIVYNESEKNISLLFVDLTYVST